MCTFIEYSHKGWKCLPVDLDSNDLDEFIKCRDVVFFELSAEEMFDVVLQNYQEMLLLVHQESVSRIIRNKYDYSSGSETRIFMNRCLYNFLSSCRTWIDIKSKGYKSIFGADSDVTKEFKKLQSDCYDNYWEYRFCDGLRNFIQHQGFPITNATTCYQSIDHENKESCYRFQPLIEKKSILNRNKKWKRKVREDIEALEDKFEILPILSVYMRLIRDISTGMYDFTSSYLSSYRESINKWESVILINDPYAIAEKLFPSLVHKESAKITSEEKCRFYLSLDPLGRIDEMRKSLIKGVIYDKFSNLSGATPYLMNLLKEREKESLRLYNKQGNKDD